MQSFLNLIDKATGRQIRLAELGFRAGSPSFSDGGITFTRNGDMYIFDLSTGMISKQPICTKRSAPENAGKSDVKIIFISDKTDGIGQCELVNDGRVLARFMGSSESLGEVPERDGKIVFFGYPSSDGIN